MDTNFPILGPVAQHGQSAGLLIQWSRDRSPSGPFILRLLDSDLLGTFHNLFIFSQRCNMI